MYKIKQMSFPSVNLIKCFILYIKFLHCFIVKNGMYGHPNFHLVMPDKEL